MKVKETKGSLTDLSGFQSVLNSRAFTNPSSLTLVLYSSISSVSWWVSALWWALVPVSALDPGADSWRAVGWLPGVDWSPGVGWSGQVFWSPEAVGSV